MTSEPVKENSVFGFWVYILTDCVLFAALFATYAVLHTSTYNGPTPEELFNLPYVFVETLLLLISSFTCGLAVLAAYSNRRQWVISALAASLLLGLSFVGMELYEFGRLLADGSGWQQSAFLSSFFTLVGTHGLHVTLGALWALVLIVHIAGRGLTAGNTNRLLMFSLFWHFLDIVWIFIFTFVYLWSVL